MTTEVQPRWFDIGGRLQQWFQSRLPLKDSIFLTQKNVYILPTAPGFMLAATLLVLLVASINYQLNLGYVLTFLLAGSALVGMHVCHANLRGISMHLVVPDAQFVGSSVLIAIQLLSERKSVRHGIGLAVLGTDHWNWTDVPAQGSARLQVGFTPGRRGQHRLPTLTAQTRFPLGTFRVWSVWRPACSVLVYPKPEAHPPPLPPGVPRAGGSAAIHKQSSGEFDGVRSYRRGDPLKLVVWKKAAKSDELVSRDAQQVQRFELWLDWAHTGLAAQGKLTEAGLSRLCAWVLTAEKMGLQYGLRLPHLEIAPGSGAAHQQKCLQALALSP
ncbi:MAG: DUF58 domain-containing protein [Burkholderiales bacterium PBB4]|nr:MAG: DUF58 domain-containing protein [Burkholderiales bacterium PBB4]